MGSRRVAGIDEAGRGAVIGPLVIAGVCFLEHQIRELSTLGVKDSKLLAPAARRRLYPRIVELADRVKVHKIPPGKVDEYVARGKRLRRLNYLEAVAMARVLGQLGPETAYVDASDVKAERFGADIAELLGGKVDIISVHHADAIFPVVSAASIIAKVERDREVEKLRRSYGDLGSGYPSDVKTVRFLEDWLLRKGKAPSFARRSWKTWRRLGVSKLDPW